MQEIYLYGTINAGDAKQFIDSLSRVRGSLTVRINSGGGSVFDGIAIGNAIAARNNVTIQIDGLAASIASYIAMSGIRTVIASNALMMLHSPWSSAADGNAEELRKTADTLDKAEQSMIAAYVNKTGKSNDEIRRTLAAETWFDAGEALAFGLVDEIFEPQQMAAMLGIDRFTNIPTRYKQMINKTEAQSTTQDAIQAQAVAEQSAKANSDLLNAMSKETERRNTIKADFSKFMNHQSVPELMNLCLGDPEISASAAGKMLLLEISRNSAPIAGHYVPGEQRHHVAVGDNQHHREFFSAATDYLLTKNGIKITSPHPASVDFRGMAIVDIARTMLSQSGGSVRKRLFGGEKPMDIFSAAMSTSDLPLLLENVASKSLQNGYDSEPSSHRLWTKQGTAKDFKPTKRVALSEAPNLELIPELGEYTYGELKEKGTGFQLETFGKILQMSRQMIVNDDLDALTKTPLALGRSAARLEADKVYELLTGNVAMADGIPLFHANHGNLLSGAALSITSLGAARAAMRLQKGMQGAILNIVPRYIIVPAALESTAEQLLASLVDPTANNSTPNFEWIRGLMLVVDARLDADSSEAWYLAADYNQVDTVEVAYLDGEHGAFIDQDTNFETDAVRIKCRLDFATAAIDWIGMIKNPGAA